MKILNQETRLEDLDVIRPHPDNPNRGNVDAIHASIDENGFFGYVVAQRSTGFILAGEHRWRAARDACATHIPVCWIDVDDTRARKILLADNRLARLGHDDEQALAALLRSLEADGGLTGTGYASDDLDQLLARLDDTPPEGWEPQEYDETAAANVKRATCPHCGHEFPV